MTVDDLLAREGIRHTIASYNMAGDSRNAAEFVALFADDAVLEFAGFPPLQGFRFQGREAIDPIPRWRQYAEMEKALGGSSFLRHNLTTCRIELTGPETAKARTYFVVFTDIGPDHCGVYTDELVRRGDRWLFAHRKIRLDWRAPESLFPVVDKGAVKAK
jgi:hypothetical protein